MHNDISVNLFKYQGAFTGFNFMLYPWFIYALSMLYERRMGIKKEAPKGLLL
jgi:hypothetical protein